MITGPISRGRRDERWLGYRRARRGHCLMAGSSANRSSNRCPRTSESAPEEREGARVISASRGLSGANCRLPASPEPCFSSERIRPLQSGGANPGSQCPSTTFRRLLWRGHFKSPVWPHNCLCRGRSQLSRTSTPSSMPANVGRPPTPAPSVPLCDCLE